MTNEKLRKIIMSALFAALACVATMIIKIPTPGTSGYIHPGDAIVILSGAILGPVWGYLLTSFYQLDDEARKEVVETIQFKLQYHRDPERAEQIKQIKGW